MENPIVPTPEPSVTTDPQVLDRDAIHVGIVGALKSAVKAHGPLSGRQIGSAAKRVLGQVLATVESQRARDHRIAWETIQQLANKVAELDDALTRERQQHRDALAAQAQEIADLKEGNRTLAHQLDRRADGMDDLTQAIRAERDAVIIELAQVRSRLTAVEQERDTKAEMHSELATLAGSAIVLATLDTLAGERPALEPDHALTEAVWRLVRERDAAYAALQTVRASLIALTPGHRTGYDWNADPLFLTRVEGEAFAAIDAALTPTSPQTPEDRK